MEYENGRGDWYDNLNDRLKVRIDYEVECIPFEKFYFFTNVRGNIDRSNFFGVFAMMDKTKKDEDELSQVVEDYHHLVTGENSKVISRPRYNAHFIDVLVTPRIEDKTFDNLVNDIWTMGYEQLYLYATPKKNFNYTISDMLKRFAKHTLPDINLAKI